MDPNPSGPPLPPRPAAESVRELKAAVRRDLEWLLNTRRNPEAGSAPPELSRSVFGYGLPDIASISHESDNDRDRLRKLVEGAIAAFEPRLTHVKVCEIETSRSVAPIIRFQIQAMLLMDPEPEHVSFDTVLQLANGEYQLQGVPRAR